MNGGFSIEDEDLYFKTGDGVLKRLERTSNPADLLGVIRTAHKGFDRAYEKAPATARAMVACCAGCGTCCHVPVGAQAHEVLLAAIFIQTRYSPDDLEATMARLSEHRIAFAGKSMEQRAALRRRRTIPNGC